MGVLWVGIAAFCWRVRQGFGLVFVAMLVMALGLSNLGCAPTLADLEAWNPRAKTGKICAFPPGVSPHHGRLIAYDTVTNRVMTNEDPSEFKIFALSADRFFEVDGNAAPSNMAPAPNMAPAHWGLTCPKDMWILPDETAFLPRKEPCPTEVAQAERRPDPRVLAQVPEVRSPLLQPLPGVAYPPNCQVLTREAEKREIRKVVTELGRLFGEVLGSAEESVKLMDRWSSSAVTEKIRENPQFAEEIRSGLAAKLTAIPELPTFDDPEYAGIALTAFEYGYNAGVDDVRQRFFALEAAITVAHLGGPALIETAGIKAINAALTRARNMPIFIPGATGGIAATLEDHNGYQKWHQTLDDDIVAHIERNKDLTPKDFAAWLYKRYKKPDLAERFPGGLGANK